jgi:PIN domain nuclease of toxin-antitoxin system
MASAVLDASVLLAHISGERGSESVLQLTDDTLLSTVNLAEVFSKLLERDLTADAAASMIYRYGFDPVPFDRELARRAGVLRPVANALGLSLGDRACLALAQREALPVLTTDRAWTKLNVGVEIKVLR